MARVLLSKKVERDEFLEHFTLHTADMIDEEFNLIWTALKAEADPNNQTGNDASFGRQGYEENALHGIRELEEDYNCTVANVADALLSSITMYLGQVYPNQMIEAYIYFEEFSAQPNSDNNIAPKQIGSLRCIAETFTGEKTFVGKECQDLYIEKRAFETQKATLAAQGNFDTPVGRPYLGVPVVHEDGRTIGSLSLNQILFSFLQVHLHFDSMPGKDILWLQSHTLQLVFASKFRNGEEARLYGEYWAHLKIPLSGRRMSMFHGRNHHRKQKTLHQCDRWCQSISAAIHLDQKEQFQEELEQKSSA